MRSALGVVTLVVGILSTMISGQTQPGTTGPERGGHGRQEEEG